MVYYPDTCIEEDVPHYCDDCEATENGRVRSVFKIKQSYTFTDPTSTAEWLAAIASGDVVVIANTHGTFDGGTPNYGQGFGDVEQRYLNSTYKLTFFDPNVKGNYEYYEGKKRSVIWKIGYRTSSLVWIADVPVTVAPKVPVPDDLKEGLAWEVEVTFTSANHPEPFTMPQDIFNCFLVS